MSQSNMVNCPICAIDASILGSSGLTLSFDCPICGHFKMLSRVVEDIKALPKQILSGVARNYWEMNHAEFYFSDKTCESKAAFFNAVPFAIPSDTDIQAKANLILRHFRRKSVYPGIVLRLSGNSDYSIGFCQNYHELHYCAKYLESRGLVEQTNPPEGADLFYRITPEGWVYLSGIGVEVEDQGFIAMAFRLETSDVLFANGLYPGIEKAHYKPQRIDRKEHNNRIDDEIVAEIRKSKFVVADLTGKNAGAYFEAGFAMGLGKPVIWTCQQSEIDAGNVHFDTRQYSIVSWEPENLADFSARLTQRIEATLGHGRYVAGVGVGE